MTGAATHSAVRGWLVLLAYALLVGASQWLWHDLVPLWSLGEETVFDSDPGRFPRWIPVLVFLLLCAPAGALVDRLGGVRAVTVAAAALAATSLLRVGDTFETLVVGQVGVCLLHPLVITAVCRVAGRWLAPRWQVLGAGLVVAAAFTGTAAGQVGMFLVEDLGARGAALVHALTVLIPGGAFALLIRGGARPEPRDRPPLDPGRAGSMLARGGPWKICGLALCGMCAFHGVAGWLVSLLSLNGLETGRATTAAGALLAGALIGCLAVPALARPGRLRTLVILCAAASLAVVYPLCAAATFPLAVALAVAFGFCCLPLWPLTLVLFCRATTPERSGRAACVLIFFAQAGASLVGLTGAVVKGSVPPWTVPVWAAVASLTLALALAVWLRKDRVSLSED